MSGVSMGHNRRPRSAEKTFRRCTNRENVGNVIHIDPDPDIFEDVVIIDLSESLSKRKLGSGRVRKDKNLFTNVIYIDDDEAPRNSNFPGANNGEAPSSSNFPGVNNAKAPSSSNFSGVNDANFSANTSHREPCPPNTNFADSDAVGEGCPYIPDNTTPVRLSKCKRTYSGKAPVRNRYGLGADSESDTSESDYDCELVEDSSGKVHWEKAFYRRRKDCHNGRSDRGAHGGTSQNLGKNQHQDSGMEDVTRVHEEASDNETGAHYTFRREGTGFGCTTIFEDPIDLECSQSAPGRKDGTDFGCSTAFEGPIDLECSQSSPGTKDGTDLACSTTFDDPIHLQNDANDRSISQAKGSPSVCAEQGVPGGFDDDIRERAESLASSVNIRPHQTKVQVDGSSSDGPQESENGPDPHVQAQNFDIVPFEEISIINEREKIKETDEYKRAQQEELASRQQVLAAQAEEAKILRLLQKRRKAESMRLLDMEKRQKQRLEEIRNTQKKDVENMNLKETIRTEVGNELKKLASKCQNMASLLQLLGINVSGWPNPLPKQVETAYKKALLTFHPDRASKSDIRLQVEAEEKFKLITLMKDKFSTFHAKPK